MTALVMLAVGFALGVVFHTVSLTWRLERQSKFRMIFRRAGELLERYKLKCFYQGLGGDLFRVVRVIMVITVIGFIWGLASRMSQPAQTYLPQQDQANTSQYSPFGKRWSPNDPQSYEDTRKINAWMAIKQQVKGSSDIDRSFSGVQKREQQRQYDDSMNDNGIIKQPKW